MKSEYDIQADNFLKKTKSKFEVKYLRNGKYFIDDDYDRDVYKVTITRSKREFTCEFGQSIMRSGVSRKAPTAYDVLACLQTYYPETFEDFCNNCGYDISSRKAKRIFKATQIEYNGLALLYNRAELDEIAEIV